MSDAVYVLVDEWGGTEDDSPHWEMLRAFLSEGDAVQYARTYQAGLGGLNHELYRCPIGGECEWIDLRALLRD